MTILKNNKVLMEYINTKKKNVSRPINQKHKWIENDTINRSNILQNILI